MTSARRGEEGGGGGGGGQVLADDICDGSLISHITNGLVYQFFKDLEMPIKVLDTLKKTGKSHLHINKILIDLIRYMPVI